MWNGDVSHDPVRISDDIARNVIGHDGKGRLRACYNRIMADERS
jgi:hypothetical protein